MQRRTVLAVDDNDDALDLIEEALAGEDVRYLRARSGPDAMSLLMSQPIDLVILDIMMPEMTGFALLEMVRFIPRLSNTTVIVQTAHDDRHNRDRARELGAQSVLHKPVSPADLREAVRESLAVC